MISDESSIYYRATERLRFAEPGRVIEAPTLRDQFAMAAPEPDLNLSWLSDAPRQFDYRREDGFCDQVAYERAKIEWSAKCFAEWAYIYADAMMKQREAR